MSMSRKDYNRVAGIIRAERLWAEDDPGKLEIMEDTARALARMFKEDNHAFDFGRFYTACGID